MSPIFPEARREAVERALSTAFGTTVLDSVVAVDGGMSGAGVYRIRVGGIAYLLRIENGRDDFRDPHRSYACMRIAAQALLAPRLRYADAEDGVAIMNFVPTHSLTLDYGGSRAELIVEAAQTVRALHAAPAFPPLVDYLDGMDAMIGNFQGAGGSAPVEVFARYAQLRSAYRTREGDLVSSHNDLNPRNILYDGTRLWFVDWEAAFLADRFVDLANLANTFVSTPQEEDLLLRTYFGGGPDEAMRARLFLMRQVNHVFYAMAMLSSLPSPARLGEDLDGPDLAQLHQALGVGDFALESPAGRTTYASSRLKAALAGMRSARFGEALAVIA